PCRCWSAARRRASSSAPRRCGAFRARAAALAALLALGVDPAHAPAGPVGAVLLPMPVVTVYRPAPCKAGAPPSILRTTSVPLPAVPAHLSGHVARIFGDGRLRHPAIVQSLAFSPDGTRLVTAGQDGTVRVWDADTGREVGFYAGHAERVSAVAYSPDGKSV